MTLLKIAAALGALYLACVLLIALAQDRLLFPRWVMRVGAVPLPADAERLSIGIDGVGPLLERISTSGGPDMLSCGVCRSVTDVDVWSCVRTRGRFTLL